MRNVRIIINRILVAIFAIMGVSGCNKKEYGTPHGVYLFRWKVVDSDSKLNINNIMLTLSTNYLHDSTFTNIQGSFTFFEHTGAENWEIQAKDIDSSENGTYQAVDTIIITKSNELHHGDGKWYDGFLEKRIIIEMKKVK